jgi:16S rRNA (adenine1518-N6/adenine1519-N6)-dimethyltransferase
MPYRHKKQFGQHFLRDKTVIEKTVLRLKNDYPKGSVLEVGPGEGVLTQEIYGLSEYELFISEIDRDLLPALEAKFPLPESNWLRGDFLKARLDVLPNPLAIVGNFPYNISTQIVFKVLENKEQIPYVLGMFQKEVGERLAAGPGSKTYGITSVLAGAYYDIQCHFTIPPGAFIPPPAVDSVILSMRRKSVDAFPVNSFSRLQKVVKTAFSQRRKTLRNSLKSLNFSTSWPDETWYSLRPEQLPVSAFDQITSCLAD